MKQEERSADLSFRWSRSSKQDVLRVRTAQGAF
jgi:hypothetical protein